MTPVTSDHVERRGESGVGFDRTAFISEAKVDMVDQRLYLHTAARYGRMAFFANDTGAVTSSLVRYGEWAEGEIAFITSLFGEGAVVLDVGAYIGTHTLAFSRHVGAGGRVLSFEPQPTSCRVLELNVACNHLHNVEIRAAAVGAQTGEIALSVIDPKEPASFGSTSLEYSSGDASKVGMYSIPALAIDDLYLGRCDFIKIDVEGMEVAVLEGARHTIEQYRPWIYAECNSVAAGLASWRLLSTMGYDVRLHLATAFNPDNFRGEHENIFADAREAALIGVPPGGAAAVEAGVLRPNDMLLNLKAADDLVLGMLNKPQYVGEVLAGCAAAMSGGGRWFQLGASGQADPRLQDALEEAQRMVQERGREADELSARLKTTQNALEETQRLAQERGHETNALAARLATTQNALETAQGLAVARAGKIEELDAALGRTQDAVTRIEALAIERAGEIDAISAQLALTQEALERTQRLAVERFGEISALQEMVAATLSQADIARALYMEETEGLESAKTDAERLSAALEEQQAFTESLAAALAAARADHEREKSQVEAILASTSWRITKPVRMLKLGLRR